MRISLLILKYLVLVLVCSTLSGGATYAALRYGADSTEVASWVQAIGSIAAILGAFAIARSQAKESDRQREQERLQVESDLCRTALLISIESIKCVLSINRKLDPRKPTPARIGTERLEEVLHSLRNLATKNLTYQVHNQILVMQCELAYTLTAVRQVNSGGSATLEREQKAQSRLKAIAAASSSLYDLARTHYQLPEVMLPSSAD